MILPRPSKNTTHCEEALAPSPLELQGKWHISILHHLLLETGAFQTLPMRWACVSQDSLSLYPRQIPHQFPPQLGRAERRHGAHHGRRHRLYSFRWLSPVSLDQARRHPPSSTLGERVLPSLPRSPCTSAYDCAALLKSLLNLPLLPSLFRVPFCSQTWIDYGIGYFLCSRRSTHSLQSFSPVRSRLKSTSRFG
jgi:hypothetical protein